MITVNGVEIFFFSSDSETVYTKAAQNVLNKYGYKLTPELKQRVVGRPSNMLARTMIEEFSLQVDEDDFVASYDSEAHDMLDNVPLMPGAERLLVHLHNERIPMAIATSSFKDSFQHKAKSHCDILSVMHHIVCGNDSELQNGKPAPDIYLLAASRFPRPVQPHCCLVFEDSPAGLRAGCAAGMQVVMTPDPLVPPELLVGATQVLPSMECFQPEQFGLPPFDYKEQFTFG